MLAPRRGHPFGGIEFTPGPGAELLMVADETAVPAVCAVLELLPDDATGSVFLEVPLTADILDVRGPAGVDVVWLAREGADARSSGCTTRSSPTSASRARRSRSTPTRWTPTCGRRRPTPPPVRRSRPRRRSAIEGTYAWIAGESTVVTGLRRHLVKELGFDRRQVAFMGYWRRGVAMRS